MDSQAIVEKTRQWIAAVVIGLELCPFARRVFQGNLIREVVSKAETRSALLADLKAELHTLVATPREQVETTLLIHPRVLEDFLDYNDFLDEADRLIDRLGYQGVVQIASFHPGYQFADTAPDAVENYTNRSPYPMLHLLREESITEIDATEEELLEIPRRNVEVLQKLGLARVQALRREGGERES